MPELRRDPVTHRWAIIATERALRPKDFHHAKPPPSQKVDPFSAGNEHLTPPEIMAIRDHGEANSPNWRVRVIPNKFPSLTNTVSPVEENLPGLLAGAPAYGAHEVIVETPDHRRSLSECDPAQMNRVLSAYRARTAELSGNPHLRYVLILKNSGPGSGASLEHVHSQLVACTFVPQGVRSKMRHCLEHFEAHGKCVICEWLESELSDGSRTVMEGESFAVVVPYASRFPYETWIVPKRHASEFQTISAPEAEELAWLWPEALRRLEGTLDRLPYNFLLHLAPVREPPLPYYHWHIEIVPRTLSTYGIEALIDCHVNTVAPERAAEELRG